MVVKQRRSSEAGSFLTANRNKTQKGEINASAKLHFQLPIKAFLWLSWVYE